MKQYLFNITFHCDAVSAPDVLYYLQNALLPAWNDYPHWEKGRLMRLREAGGSEQGEEQSYALQFFSASLDELKNFTPSDDPFVQRIERAYGNRVLFTDTILELLSE